MFAARLAAVVIVLMSAWVPGAAAQPLAFPSGSRVIDAADFGAVGDGVADDTAAINAALAAPRVSGSSAKLVYLGPGTYRVTDTIAFPDSRIVLQGAGEGLTVIRLDDHAPGFEGALDGNGERIVKNVVSTRESTSFSANQFRVSVRDLTIDIGAGNLGATGLKYHNNNQGTVRNVTIRSSDPGKIGSVGLEMSGSDKGPGMIRGVTVDGFDIGIRMTGTEYSMVFEDITLTDQHVYAIFNVWNIMTFRGLTTSGTVPVLWHDVDTVNQFRWGMVTIIDGDFTALPGTPTGTPALLTSSSTYLHDCVSTGYSALVEFEGEQLPFTVASEWTSDRVERVWPSPAGSLGLTIEDVPEVVWDDPAALAGDPSGWWANAEDFGADGTDGAGDGDDAPGVQAAIDSGATSVMMPAGRYHFGSPVVLRGSVRRVILMEGDVQAIPPLDTSGGALFVTDASNPGPVVVERGTLGTPNDGVSSGAFLHETPGTLVVRNTTGGLYEGSGSGKAFIEDTVSGPHRVSGGQRVWFRQLNPENTGTKLFVDGADVLVLGLKTEKQGTPIEATGGARVELIGGLIYPVQTLPLDQPMFRVVDSDFSAIIGESSFSASSNHNVIVEQTRAGELRRLFGTETEGRVGFFRGVRLCLYSGSNAMTPTPSGPVAAYAMDETMGSVIADASGNMNDGTTMGAPAWVPGLLGHALSFDGVSQSAELPAGLLGSDAGAVAFWMRSTQTPAEAGHIVYFSEGTTGDGGGSDNEGHVTLNPGGEVSLFINGAPSLTLSGGGAVNDGQWHHIVASWDRSGYADLYVDGRRVARSRTGGWNGFGTAGGRVLLARPNAATRFYAGDLDQLRLWDRAVTHDEVYGLLNAERGFANYPPDVDAGRDQVIQDPSYARALEGQAVDDLQPVGMFDVSWSVVDGPLGPGAGVVFSDASDPTSSATFAQAGAYTLRLVGDDTVESDADEVVANVFDPLLTPWDNDDVGSVGLLGWALQPSTTSFELNGSGRRIGGNPASGGDTFHFAYRDVLECCGVEIVARVDSVENTAADARAGVMYRQQLSGTSANGFVYATAGGAVGFTSRGGTNGGTGLVQEVAGVGFPVYLRMRRESTNAFRGYYSTDGVNWTELADESPATATTVNMGGGPKLVGLAVTAGDNNRVCNAVFGEVFVGAPCLGDFDRDGDVDLGDFGIFGGAFGSFAGDPSYNAAADFDNDGDVDLGDFGIFGGEFGLTGCVPLGG
ncbi:MAG: hypothetical protein Tsb0013_20340 [Phycisphaerales bacterium]